MVKLDGKTLVGAQRAGVVLVALVAVAVAVVLIRFVLGTGKNLKEAGGNVGEAVSSVTEGVAGAAAVVGAVGQNSQTVAEVLTEAFTGANPQSAQRQIQADPPQLTRPDLSIIVRKKTDRNTAFKKTTSVTLQVVDKRTLRGVPYALLTGHPNSRARNKRHGPIEKTTDIYGQWLGSYSTPNVPGTDTEDDVTWVATAKGYNPSAAVTTT